MLQLMNLTNKNPHLDQIQKCFVANDKLYIFKEYDVNTRPLTSLLLSDPQPMNETRAMALFFQMFIGVAHIHNHSHAHRNLTVDNLLFSLRNNRLIVSGMELVCHKDLHEDQHMRNADPKFRPPEIKLFHKEVSAGYDPRSGDIWALGVILYMLMTKNVLFQMANVRDPKYRRFVNIHRESLRSFIREADPQFTVSEGVMVLLENMLQIDPTKRWDFQRILRHEPIQELLKQSNARTAAAASAASRKK